VKPNKLPDYLAHIQLAATDACGFIHGMAKEAFLADRRSQNAVVMSLIVLGEASTKVMELYPDFAQSHASVPWRQMRGMRNRIAHGYFEVDFDMVWDTVTTALPLLLGDLPGVHAAAEAYEPPHF
jgi:uncharacterized protein with HEPN domain